MKKTFLLLSFLLCNAFGYIARADSSSDLYRTGAGDLLKYNSSRTELMFSNDEGASWHPIFGASRIWRFTAHAANKIWIGYRCGPESACVSFSEDKGVSWANLPFDIPYMVKTFFAASNGLDVVMDGDSSSNFRYLVSYDGGKTFSGSSVLPPFFIREK
ncbi:MAG: hypothetical protein ACXVCU_19150 [Bdellovibrio sp.]